MTDLSKNLSKGTVILFILLVWLTVFTACGPKQATISPEVVKPPELKAIKSITAFEEADSYLLKIESNRVLTYTSIKKPLPLSVVLYFPETVLDNTGPAIDLDNDVIHTVTASMLSSEGQAAKIEIGLKKDTSYEVLRQENGLLVIFNKVSINQDTVSDATAIPPFNDSTPIVASSDAAESEENLPVVQGSPEKDEQALIVSTVSEEKEDAQADQGPAWVNRIDFASEEAGKSTIIIGTTTPVTYTIKKKTDTWVQLRLNNTNLPDYRKHPLITTRFESAVDRIIPVQKPEMKTETLFSIELRESVPYYVEQTDNFIMIHFEASAIAPKPLEEADLPSWKRVMAEIAIEEEAAEKMAGAEGIQPIQPLTEAETTPAAAEIGEAEAVGAVSILAEKPKKFTGEKIALDFFETDIKNVFRILREISGKNFAIDKDVSGRVTLTLDKPVPWDQVLDLVLRMNQLGMIYEGDIIRIATLTTLKKEEDLRAAKIAAAMKSLEQEKALEPLVTEYISVNYSNAQNEIMPHVKNILTPDRGKATVDTRNNQIIITDVADKIWQAKEIVNRIDKVTPQVIIEARIAEVSTDVSSELGFDWTVNAGPVQNNDLDGIITGDPLMAMNFPASGATSSVGFTFDHITGTPFILNARLNALESEGEGKIISSPKIVTLDNKKAKIKQGIEYPYLERDDTGGSSVSFKDIDLLLEVTPHVTPDNRVSLEIKITKNDIDTITQGVPSLSTNEAETELLVNDGDTIVIGGIMKTRKTNATAGFPWLSKIPVLGWFFKSETDSKESSELLIFITPKIVQLEQRQIS
jgi:type IV pilus assembly protein PilQ